MCSCDTSSGRTVSAQRQAAFSSCSRGAMALARGAPPELGSRCRPRSRPIGLCHLPAMKTRRSLSQLASQSPARATTAAPARARPARRAAKRRCRHPTPPPAPYSRRRWRYTLRRGGRMRVPSSLCTSRFWADGRRKGKRSSGIVLPRPHRRCWEKQLLTTVQGSVLRTTTLTSLRLEGRRLPILALRFFPFNREGITREATQRTP